MKTTYQKPRTIQEMKDRHALLISRAEALENRSRRRFDNAPGSAVTGSSGRLRSGLHKKTNRAIEGSLNDLQEAKKIRERAGYWFQKAYAIEHAEEIEAAKAKKKAIHKEVDRRLAARKAALPLVNDPSASYHMTSAEWKKIPSDYKDISEGDGYRYRSTIYRGGRMEEVFLTDSKANPKGDNQ